MKLLKLRSFSISLKTVSAVTVAALGLLGCVTSQERYPRSSLIDQVLKVRPGHKGLTNRACEAWSESGECTSYVIKEYFFEDEAFRQTINKLGFVCVIAGKRYKVCLDKPGFCRISYRDGGIFSGKKRKEEYMPGSDYQFLLDGKARCMNKEHYPFD